VKSGNLFTGATPPAEGEFFETLLNHRNLVIERIISSATITPTEYVQTQDEWVLLVAGAAVLEVGGCAARAQGGGLSVFACGCSAHGAEHIRRRALVGTAFA
jgi:cupin 2 domain-containing protein